MSTHVTGTFEHQSWDEQPFVEGADGSKLTHATIKNTYTGGIEGAATLAYLMSYPAGADVTFVGLQHVDGAIDGKRGTFVLQHLGVFADGVAQGTVSVVPGSGTGALAGLAGDGTFVTEGQTHATMTLDYTLG